MVNAFGHAMPAIVRPQARRLHCRDPRIVANYVKKYEQRAIQYELLPRVEKLLSQVKYPLSYSLQQEFEELDSLRCSITREAEQKCRKLRKSQVAFSLALQLASRHIKLFLLLHKKLSGRKVSSRLIMRTLAKTGLNREVLGLSKAQVETRLKESYSAYYQVKKGHVANRQSYLEDLASALADQQDTSKVNMIHQLKEREHQRAVARKIRYLQGKLNRNSTTMVTIEATDGSLQDITDKVLMEQAIMDSNAEKFRQSHHRPFYKDPLKRDFGFKDLTPASGRVLAGVYESNLPIPLAEQLLLKALHKPTAVREAEPQPMDISLVNYRYFWSRARETTSSYPCAVSFSTMKAGSTSNLISAIECHLTRIPLLSGYAPLRWRKCLDVMIPKKSGITTLSGLRTICLFATDCNFAFKHIGRAMMGLAEKTKALAPEQYSSRKRHRVTDLAVNKALTYDIV